MVSTGDVNISMLVNETSCNFVNQWFPTSVDSWSFILDIHGGLPGG